MAELKWQSINLDHIGLPEGITTLFNNFDSLAKNINQLLKNIKTALTVVNTFLLDNINPLLLLLQFILQEILDFIDTLREAGIYHISIMPSKATNTRFIKLKDVFPGVDISEERGFHILTTDDIFQKYVASFDDEGDLKKPPTEDDVIAGGFVVFAGFGDSDVKLFVSGLTKMFELVQTVSNLFIQLTNGDEYRKLYRETTSLLNVMFESEEVLYYPKSSTSSIGDSTIAVDASIHKSTPGKIKGGKIRIKVGTSSQAVLTGQPESFSVRFNSWTNTKNSHVFNLAFLRINAQEGTTSNIITSTSSFKNLKVGDLVLNLTRSNSVSYILGITSDNRISISPSITGQTDGDDIRFNAVPLNWINVIPDGDKIYIDDPKGPELRKIPPTAKSEKPDWQTVKLARDLIPPLGDLLDDIFGVVEGFKDQATGASQAMANLIEFIEAKIDSITAVQTKIASVRNYFQTIRDTFAALESVNLVSMRGLYVNPQVGGINILKQAVLDKDLTDAPGEFQYCMLYSAVGSGPGLGLISFLLGLRPDFDLTEPQKLTIPFDEDAAKKEYGLG